MRGIFTASGVLLVGLLMGCTPAGDTDDSAIIAPGPTDVFPASSACQGGIVEQAFEHGRMFWVGASAQEKCVVEHSFAPGTGEIWVVLLDESGLTGDWLIFPDGWQAGRDAESDPALVPSDGLMQPVRGFGRVWRLNLTEVERAELGWALSPEAGFVSEYRYDPGGLINPDGDYIPRPGQHRLVGLDGTLYFFDELSLRVAIVPGS